MSLSYYPKKLGKGNIFRHPPKGADTPRPQEQTPPHRSRHHPEQTPPRADIPLGADPQSRHLPGTDIPREQKPPRSRHPPRSRSPQSRHLPGVDTPQSSACWEIRATSGQYASYWLQFTSIRTSRIICSDIFECKTLKLLCMKT